MPQIAVVAGEVSGDIHAGNLVAALRELRPDARVWGIGGERLEKAGAEILYPSSRIAAMGLFEAAGRLPDLMRARRLVVERFDQNPPDLFVPVDFGGFNLGLAAKAKARGIPVVYFIPPKAWAWGGWRVKKIRALVDELLVILPFEEDFWRGHGVPCAYVGSPVLDHLAARRFAAEDDVVGLLPGSRMSEISRIWPLMVRAAQLLAQKRRLRFLVPRAEGLPSDCLKTAEAEGLDLTILDGDAQQVMERARACLVASGTATLECALVGTPLVAVYRVNALTYMIGKRLIKLPFVTLPNLVMGRGIVPELLQTPPVDAAREVFSLLGDTPERRAMLDGYAELRLKMGEPGASARAAARVADRLPAPSQGKV